MQLRVLVRGADFRMAAGSGLFFPESVSAILALWDPPGG